MLNLAGWTTDDFHDAAAKRNKIYKVGAYDSVSLKPGDILWEKGHVAIYIGNNQVAEASSPENGLRIETIYKFTEVYRLKDMPSADKVEKNMEKFKWPDGSKLVIVETNLDDFENEGIRQGVFGVQEYDFGWVVNTLLEIVDWFIGITTYVFRMVIIGWTAIIEMFINSIMSMTTGEDASLTIEKLVYNQVPFLDVNFFNFKTAGGVDLEQNSIMYVIRENIAAWYYIIRSVSIIGLLITLLYLGIRMALATVGEQKAKYKEMLVSWFVSFIIVFGIHYIMILILGINESLIDLIHVSLGGGEESLYDSIRSNAYSIKASVGWPSLIMYAVLIYLMVRFLFMYFKRFLVVAILTFMAPIIGVTYSIDKIKDNKSQSLSNWLKEYSFNVIIQSVHALLYALLVGLAFDMAGKSIMGSVIAILMLNFILKAESIFKKIFGIKSGQLKDALKSAVKIMAVANIAKKITRSNFKAVGLVSTPITKPIKNIASRANQYRRNDKVEKVKQAVESARDLGNTNIQVGKNNFEIGELLSDGGFSSEKIGEELVSKTENMKELNKEYRKQEMSKALNTIWGSAQLMAAVPMTIVDGEEGLMLGNSARKTLKKGINGSKTKKKYSGRFSGLKNSKHSISNVAKNMATAGAYGKIKSINSGKKQQVKNITKVQSNAQYEIIVNKLEKDIEKEEKELKKTVDKKELEKVIKSAKSTVSDEAVMETAYKTDLIEGIGMDDIGSEEDIDTLYKDLKNANKKAKKIVMNIDTKKFEKDMNRQLTNEIIKETGKNRKDVTKEDINQKFRSMNEEDKKKMVKNLMSNNIEIADHEKDTIAKSKTNMDINKVNSVIEQMKENSHKKIQVQNYKNNFESRIKDLIEKDERIERNNITVDNMNDYISNMTNEELVREIKTAGTYKDSFKRDKNINKAEYQEIVQNIQKLKYYKAQMKG